MRIVLSIVAAVSAALGLAVLAPVPALAAQGGGFAVSPAEGGDWVRVRVGPGGRAQGVAVVTNDGAAPLPVVVYAADAATTPQGGFSLGAPEEPRNGVGAWLSVAESRLVLPPRSRTPVAWQLAMPPAAGAGEHAGGILVQRDPTRGTAQELGNGVQVHVDVVERVGLRMYVTVPGATEAGLATGSLRWERSGDRIRFVLPVTNTGSRALRPTGTVRVHGRRPRDVVLRFTAVDGILPGRSAALVAWWDHPPTVLWAVADAVVDAEGATARSSIRLRLVPVVDLVGVAVGLGIVGAGVVRARRRVRHRAPEPALA